MFTHITSLFLSVLLGLPLAAIATVIPRDLPASQCNPGNLQCCNSVQSANSPTVGLIAGLLGIVLGPVNGQVGLTCTPISVVGVDSNACTQQPVCCTGSNFSGLLVLDCTPVDLNL